MSPPMKPAASMLDSLDLRGHFDRRVEEQAQMQSDGKADMDAQYAEDHVAHRLRVHDLASSARLENHLAAATKDMVTLPAHYAQFKLEPVHYIGENGLDWFQGNIVKYVSRHKMKNGLEDIAKVIRYAQMYREFLKGNPDWWTPDFKPMVKRG